MQPWVDTGGHSTAMGRQRGHSTAMGRQRGSQYSHGQTKGSQYSHGQTKGVTVQPWADKGVTVQPWADKGGHSTAMGRQRRSQYSYGQTKGVAVQPWVDTRGQRTAMRPGLYSRTNSTAEVFLLIQCWTASCSTSGINYNSVRKTTPSPQKMCINIH